MQIGRYRVYREIARGGMATVHLGRLASDGGVGRLVAVKRLHAQVATDADFRSMFLDEARLAARIRHPNVVSLIDLVASADDLSMILEYIEGDNLASLIRTTAEKGERIPDPIVAAIMTGALRGLHAAHDARAEDGSELHLVHRDVSPQNVLVGIDGLARVADFGVAKAVVRAQTTREGQIKGKLGYMAPEQLRGDRALDRRGDIFAAGVVLWEALVQRRLFQGESEGQILMKILTGAADPPSESAAGIDRRWDPIVERALALDPAARFSTALEMSSAIEAAFPIASPTAVGAWVRAHASELLEARAVWIAEIEAQSGRGELATVPDAPPVFALQGTPASGPDTSTDAVSKVAEPRARSGRGPWTASALAVAAIFVGILAWRERPRAESLESRVRPASLGGLVGRLASAAPSQAVSDDPPIATASASAPSPSPSAPTAAGRPAGTWRPSKPPPPSERCTLERYYDPKEGIDKFRRVCK